MRANKKPSIAGRLGGGIGHGIGRGLRHGRGLGRERAAILFVAAALLLGVPVSHADAPVDSAIHAPQAASLASRLIGTWKLIAIRDRDPATGRETPADRAADDGQLIYSPNGRLSVQIARKGRESAPKGSADGFSSYFGRWELLPAEGCVIHHQDGNLNYAQSGQAAKRYYSFDREGHLSLATPPSKRDDGRVMSTVFVWEKIP